MPRYADPTRCPDCASYLPTAPARCPVCALPLTGPVAGPLVADLLTTLHRADLLLADLGHLRTLPLPTPVSAESATGVADSATDRARVGDTSRRLGMGSVPRVLLGLGATCLLVAAVIFLAVAWSWLGVGGRTAVLLGATVASGVLGVRLGARGLRVGAESLTAVSLGLVVLDLVGAADAGWLGDPGEAVLAILLGGAVAAGGAALLVLSSRGHRPLVAPQLGVLAGALLAGVASLAVLDATAPLLAVQAAGCALVVRVTTGRAMPWLSTGSWALGVLAWASLLGDALTTSLTATRVAGELVTVSSLWGGGGAAALLLAALVALLPVAARPDPACPDPARPVLLRGASLGVAASIVTGTIALPVVGGGPSALAVAAAAAVLVWSGVLIVGRSAGPRTSDLARAAMLPLALSSLPVVGLLLTAGARAAVTVLEVPARAGSALLDAGVGVRLDPVGPASAVVHPGLVLPLAAVLLLAAGAALAGTAVTATRPVRVGPPAGILALAVLVTLAQYAVPLALLVGLLLAAGLGVLVATARRGTVGVVAAGVGVTLMLAGAAIATPSAVLLSGALVLLIVVALVALLPGLPGTSAGAPAIVRAAGPLLVLAAAGAWWSTAHASGLDARWSGPAVLVLVGLVALALPRLEVEVASVAAALLGAPAAIEAAASPSTSLAVHLTLAGALVVATALVHRDRRVLAPLGGLLLVAATWVRLGDLGVSAPEPYTLPSALVLVGLGLLRLHRDPTADTRTALAPGLLLATVPSLLWVFDDPASSRAPLLGAACLVLVLLGAQRRWSAPLVVGAAVGGSLVLRQLAPYVVQTPQWVVIGLAGVLLTVVGISWERRLEDLRRAGSLIGALR